jgi:long-chain acyl-CoA synthetase
MGEIISGRRRLATETLEERAARAARGLESLGVGRGDLIALCLRNDFAFFEATFAAGLIGAYPTPVNWHATPAEAAYVFENSGAKAIVIHADLLARLRSALPAGAHVFVAPTPPEIAEAYGVAAALTAPPSDFPEWSAWLEGFSPLDGAAGEPPGTIIYTSGTTGRPKGVRRPPPTPEQAAAYRAVLDLAFGFKGHGAPGEIVSAVTGPMYHSSPSTHGRLSAQIGAKVVLQPRFDAEDLLRLIERERVTHLHMVPMMFIRLLNLPDEVKRKYDVSSLRFVAHGAAPCPPPVKRAMIDWWGPVIYEYYGGTEISIVTCCSTEEWLAHPGSVGRPVPGARVRVIDESGDDLPPGEAGEVVARNPGMADFTYHGDDQKRRDAEKAGLISLGDVGYFDREGYLYLCDRARDMIISGGVNIYPAEIEAELLKMPGVADCAVFGVPDAEYGEAVCAHVQPASPGAVDAEGVKAWLRGLIAGFKVPKRVEIVAQLPREDSGKIFKRKLREPYWTGLERRI